MSMKFYNCAHCGNVVVKTVDSGVPVVCCGEKMQLLEANTVEASVEKHVPVVTQIRQGELHIEVGSQPHPMTPEHHIAFVCVETDKGYSITEPKGSPCADICIGQDTPVAIYEYCNLHGLWKKEI